MHVHEQQARLAQALRDADYIVAKAARVREVARIARLETQMRQFLNQQWNRLARQATDNAMRRLRASGERVTDRDIRAIIAAVNKPMGKWSKRVTPRVVDDVEDIYILAREAGHRKATGQTRGSLQYNTTPFAATPARIDERAAQAPVPQVKRLVAKQGPLELLPAFDVFDRETVLAMQQNQTLWIGQHYGKNVSDAIADTTNKTIIEGGRSRAVAARSLQAKLAQTLKQVVLPTGFSGTSKQYFEGLVANAATTARVHGQLNSFAKNEFETYVIVNPLDERTCPICGHMDDKTFTVQQGRDVMEAEVAAQDPDAVKKAHPWIGEKQMLKISPKPGPVGDKDRNALAKAGFNLPPFHFRCRCTVDVA